MCGRGGYLQIEVAIGERVGCEIDTEEMDAKFICFFRRCVRNHKQIFRDSEKRSHASHREETRRFNSQQMNELIQLRGKCARDAIEWAQQYLFHAINLKMSRLHARVEKKYWNVTKDIIASRFANFLGENQKFVEQFEEGAGRQEKLWLLNGLYHGKEGVIREGVQVETILMAEEITTELKKELEIITDELVTHNISTLSKFVQKPRLMVKEEEKDNMVELISSSLSQSIISQQKTKQIKKKRGRKPMKREKRQPQHSISSNDNPEPKRIQLFQVNSMKDIPKATPCERLVINHQITEQKLIDLIIKLRPRQLFNNCGVFCSKNFFDKIPTDIKLGMNQFFEHWDFKDYEKIGNFLYFYSQENDTRSQKKLHISSQHWRDLRNLSNIWISSNQDLIQIKKAKLSYDKITYLTILPCGCKCKGPKVEEVLKEFEQIRTLDSLVISNVKLNKDISAIACNLIRNNPNITCLAINYTGEIGNALLKAISKLKLSKLMIYNKGQPEEDLDFSQIFRMETLQYLTIQRARLSLNDIKQISCLKNLVHLDLYDCTSVRSTVLDLMHPNTYRSLVHLNLGYCELDDLDPNSLRKFKFLHNLNLDGALFNCQKVFRELMNNPLTNITRLSIFNYQDQPFLHRQCRDKFMLDKQTLVMISRAFPNITYLAIGFDCMLKQIDLDIFEKLKSFRANERCKNIIYSNDSTKSAILSKEKKLN